MIFSTTLKKLEAKGATVYRVDVPAHTVMGVSFPFHHDYFATQAQAETYAAHWRENGASPAVKPLKAAMNILFT